MVEPGFDHRASDFNAANLSITPFLLAFKEEKETGVILANCISTDGSLVELSDFIRDVKISSEITETYDDFDVQPEGFYNIISVDDAGDVTETKVNANDYKEMARPSRWDRDPFRWIRFVRVWQWLSLG